jgi:hypothetical protein
MDVTPVAAISDMAAWWRCLRAESAMRASPAGLTCCIVQHIELLHRKVKEEQVISAPSKILSTATPLSDVIPD